jgi:hypothetical protein
MSGSLSPKCVAVSAGDSLVIAGGFFATINLGGGNLVPAGGSDIFVAKFDPNGNLVWSKRFGGTSDEFSNSIAVDASANIYVVGAFSGTVNFGGGSLTASANDVYVLKLSPAGSHVWSRKGGGSNNDTAVGVVVDSNQDVVVTGFCDGSATFGGVSLTGLGSTDVFVAKYDGSGNVVWAVNDGGSNSDDAYGVALDASDNIYVAGDFYGTAVFGADSLISAGGEDAFLAKYEADGDNVWAKGFGDNNSGGVVGDKASAVCVRPDGTVVMGGNYFGSVDFGGGALGPWPTNPNGDHECDVFLAAFDATGRHLWSQSYGSEPADYVRGMASDSDGDICITGAFEGFSNSPGFFGGDSLAVHDPGAGGSDIYIAKYSLPSLTLSDASVIVCPKGDIDSLTVSLDFNDNSMLATVPRSAIKLYDPAGTVTMYGSSSPTADGSATSGNGYTSTLAYSCIGGCSGGQQAAFRIKVNDRMCGTVFADVISPDFDGGGVVDGTDLATFQATYSKCPGNTGYDACANFVETGGGCVNLSDFSYFSVHYSSNPSLQHQGPGSPLPASGANGSPQLVVTPTGSSGEYIMSLDDVGSIRAGAFQIDMPGTFSGWRESNDLNGDAIISTHDGATWLMVVAPGGEDLGEGAIELGTLRLADAPSMSIGHPDQFVLRAGDLIARGGSVAMKPGVISSGPRPASDRVVYKSALQQNVPNPFNPVTAIQFTSATTTRANLQVYAANGQLVATLMDGPVTRGEHRVEWNGRDNAGTPVSSGVYFYRLRMGDFVSQKKMVLLK